MGRLPACRQHREAQRHALLAQRADRERQLQTDRQGTEKVRHDCVIHGELVAFDPHGISSFQLLQNALRTTANLHYCAFDLMTLDGKDLRVLPLVERKERLRAILPEDPLLIYSEHWPEDGKKLFKEASRRGLEGIMAKRASQTIHCHSRQVMKLAVRYRVLGNQG